MNSFSRILVCWMGCAVMLTAAASVRAQSASVIQNTLQIRWQYYFGGGGADNAAGIAAADDGGFFLAGYTRSDDDNVHAHHGDNQHTDFWIIKISSAGALQWERSLGGSNYDEAAALVALADGGVAVAGASRSDDGDVTGHHGGGEFSDAWIVKLDRDGNVQWERSLGGSDFDAATAIAATNDGGVIVAGESNSNDGDVTGHHGTQDFSDAWIARLDARGALTWQRSVGGTDNDAARAVVAARDGGFIVAGVTSSADGDVAVNHGGEDLWIFKLDSAGTLLWSRTAGGARNDGAAALVERSDGMLFAAGYTASNDGDVHGHHGAGGNTNAWIVQLDRTGAPVHDSAYGGTAYDEANAVALSDGGVIFAATAESQDGDVAGHSASSQSDIWIVALDSAGAMRWQRVLGGAQRDAAAGIARAGDGGWIVAGTSRLFDAHNGHHGGDDLWVLKLDRLVTVADTAVTNACAVFPNPFSTTATITLPADADGGTLALFDLTGHEVKRIAPIIDGHVVIDRQDLRHGTYFYRIVNNGKMICDGQLVVE